MGIKTKLTIGLTIIGLLILMLYPYYRDWRKLKEGAKTSISLAEDEREKYIIEDREVTTVTRKGEKLKVKTNPGARKTVITVKNDGTIDVYSPTWGFVFEPGYTAFIAEQKCWIGIDSQWFYWNRLGLLSGIGVKSNSQNFRFKLNLISIGYTLPFKLVSNTTIYAGIDDKREFLAGLRVRW